MVFRAEIEGWGVSKTMHRARAFQKNFFKNAQFLSQNPQEKNIENSPVKRRGGGIKTMCIVQGDLKKFFLRRKIR